MRKKSLTISPIILAACLIGCAQAPVHDVEADDAAIRVMYEQRLERIQGSAELESVVASYMSVLADDAVMMPPNAPPVEGAEAVEAWVRNFFGSYELDVQDWPMDVLEIGPQLAVRRFRSVGTYIPKGGGDPVPYDQKYVDHLRKSPDGSWRIVLHMWSPNNTEPNIWHLGEVEVEGLQVEEGFFPGADGVRLFYRKVGVGPETAVYLHGGPFSMADGGYELDDLAYGRTLIAFDQRSGGKSDLVNDPDLLTVEHYLRDLDALRQYFGLAEMTLIGQSWGAGLATLYSARHPGRVVRLLLLSPMPPARDPYMGDRISATDSVIGEAEVARMNAIPAEMMDAPDSLVPELCEERIRLMFQGYLTDLSALDRMKVAYCDGTPTALRHQEMASATAGTSLGAWDFRAQLETLTIPILVVEGEDSHVPLEATRVWVESSPNSRLLLIPDANHMTWLEGDIPAFFRAMNRYLGGEWPEGAVDLGTPTG